MTDAIQGRAQQAALYGEPLADRFARVLRAYGIPQSRLAAVIGLSAPMLSQLASGQRVKISNPAVYGRLLRLEELAAGDAVRSGDPALLAAALDEVSASQPSLTTEHASTPPAAVDPVQVTLAHLARTAPPEQLLRAASVVPGSELAVLLSRAAHAVRR